MSELGRFKVEHKLPRYYFRRRVVNGVFSSAGRTLHLSSL